MNTLGAYQNSRNWVHILMRFAIILCLGFVIMIIWLSNLYFTQYYSHSKRSDAERELALYSGRLLSELQRVSVVPLLLSKNSGLLSDLQTKDYKLTTQRLITTSEEIGAASIILLERFGRIVATSHRADIGKNLRSEPFFFNAIRDSETIFTISDNAKGKRNFYYSRKLTDGNKVLGVIVVEVGLDDLFSTWSDTDAIIMAMNSEGIVVLSSKSDLLNQSLETALLSHPTLTMLDRVVQYTGNWNTEGIDAYFQDKALYRLDTSIPFQGWRLTYLAPFQSVRDKVNAIIALEIMALSIILSIIFYMLSRRANRKSFLFKAESAELRVLNERLQLEINHRERAEENLQVAETNLQQSSKLAALGEMSAAISHELNQPLTAMRTYLAGAKLLLGRKRIAEALSSFQRIDDLIERMGLITKQLKSYARKGSDDLIPVDLKESLTSALSIMGPQLGQDEVEISKTLPDKAVMVMADPVRVEQVIINLLRNALEAMKGQIDKSLVIMLSETDMACLTIQDNGPGIESLDELFEPFFTTKKPGEGVGLGLAISSSIAQDLNGRLFARNLSPRGAVFEFHLPKMTMNSNNKIGEPNVT